MGSWEDPVIAPTAGGGPDLDFIDFPICHLTNGTTDHLEKAADMAEAARAAGKQDLPGETSL